MFQLLSKMTIGKPCYTFLIHLFNKLILLQVTDLPFRRSRSEKVEA